MDEVRTVRSEHPVSAGQESAINLCQTSLQSSEFSNEANDKLEQLIKEFNWSNQTPLVPQETDSSANIQSVDSAEYQDHDLKNTSRIMQQQAAFFTPSLPTGQTKQKQVSNEGHKKSEHTLRKENALYALNVGFGVGLACGMIGVPLGFFGLFALGVTLSSMAAGFMALGIVMALYILHSERKDERISSAISRTI
ncbi:hypothetical protein [Legionella bononiensis]|uniref:Uncharacterized protein n=1 Tax=Legionella bononiensis TaxID=2793102 RepID=A0ABS1WC28_9GAMM|nr:hypothetical protein [Legionella bononiensis]MBL7479167.1 hypothetical protein [Legionella bononiensis]MBL7526903.1 hypothetical protein [Legionella bononiensis]MBL7563817.1 hypothetical protein [Legionella bononiensis]